MRQKTVRLGLLFVFLCMSFVCPWAVGEGLPKFAIEQLEYQGAFRLPFNDFGESNINYAQGPIGFNPDGNSLFVVGNAQHQAIAEFSIPALVKSTDINELNQAASPKQAFSRVLSRVPVTIPSGLGIKISGLLYLNGKLIVNTFKFYDQAPHISKTTVIVDNASDLQSSSIYGHLSMEGGARAAGWMASIPTEWQSALGGTHLSGFTNSTRRAIIYNSSVGPAAYAFDANSAVNNASSLTNIPTSQLINYNLAEGLVDAEDLYNESGQNNLWTHASEGSFGMIIPGTSTYAVFGFSGGHESGMGYGTPPYGGYKGHYTNDKYDNYNYYWLYNVEDLVSVKNGSMKASDIKPYKVGIFSVPFQAGGVSEIVGGAYDSANKVIYFPLEQADKMDGGYNAPVIVAYKLTGVVESDPAPEPSPSKAPGNVSVN